MSIKPDLSKDEFESIISSVLNGKSDMVVFKTAHERKDKSIYPVEVHLQKTVMGDRPVFVAMIVDITKCIEWEHKLQSKQDETEGITNELAFQKIALEEHAIVWVVNDSECIINVNKKCIQVSKYDESELLGKNFRSRLVSGDEQTEGLIEEMFATINRGNIWRGVLCLTRKDGVLYWSKTTITPFFNKNAEIYQYVVVGTDITEQKIIEEKLLNNNAEKYKAHMELAFQKRALDEHAIVSITDAKGCITYANDKFCNLSQYSKDELIGNNHNILKSGVHTKEFYSDIWQTISHGQVWKGEICNKKKDGTFYWLAATMVPFLSENGKPHKYISIRFDITAQKNIEQQLIDRNKEIEKAHKELDQSHHMMLHSEKLASVGQLAAGIAHEINTPIQFVGDNTRFLKEAFGELIDLVSIYEELASTVEDGSVNLQLVKKVHMLSNEVEVDYLSEEIPNAIEQSLDGVDRISKIVRSMKDFSHPGSDNMESINLNHSIESTINVSRNEWKYVAEMVTDFDENLTAVLCYPGELNQVILNMIVNAAHAITDARDENDPLGTIKISTRSKGNSVEIRITDSGSGMTEEVRKHIFEPFFTTKGVGKGTGQGLAIAYSVIDKHKGNVTVESELGKGTTFIINIPMNDAEGLTIENESPTLTGQSGVM